jgi:hypothetical protein
MFESYYIIFAFGKTWGFHNFVMNLTFDIHEIFLGYA